MDGDRNAGVDFACHLVSEIRNSGTFEGVHLVPLSRYREIAARLEMPDAAVGHVKRFVRR